jgi:hypothetical protein
MEGGSGSEKERERDTETETETEREDRMAWLGGDVMQGRGGRDQGRDVGPRRRLGQAAVGAGTCTHTHTHAHMHARTHTQIHASEARSIWRRRGASASVRRQACASRMDGPSESRTPARAAPVPPHHRRRPHVHPRHYISDCS